MLRRVLRHSPMIALCASVTVAACSKGADASADSAKKADSAAAASAAPSATTPAPAPATPALTDARILGTLDADNVSDSTAGALAAGEGTSASVKEFGRLMVKDHHAMRVEGMAVAKKAGVTPEAPSDADAAAEKAVGDSLASATKGAAWDKAFIDHAVEGHTKVLQFAQDAANATQNADIKALIQKATPTVQKHLDKAKDIQGKLPVATP
jgi:putative membrane protein